MVRVELCNVEDGEPYCTTHITPRIGGPPVGLMAGGDNIPPVAVVTEGSHRLVAIDVRTGEPRWRFASRSGGEFRMTKGRTRAPGDLWRGGRSTPSTLPPAKTSGVLPSADASSSSRWSATKRSSQPRFGVGGRGALFAIDLYSGQPRWQRELQGPPTSDPCAAANVALVSTAGDEAALAAHCLQTGKSLWETRDPGLGIGGAGLTFDETWIVNAPFGQLSALDVRSGNVRWSTNLADALADEIPRRLEPVLRGGRTLRPRILGPRRAPGRRPEALRKPTV